MLEFSGFSYAGKNEFFFETTLDNVKLANMCSLYNVWEFKIGIGNFNYDWKCSLVEEYDFNREE